MSNASIWDPVRPIGSLPQYEGRLFVTNEFGDLDSATEITDRLQGLSVSVNWLGTIKYTMRATLLEPVTVRPLVDFLMPTISMRWWGQDGQPRKIVNEPLGVFAFLMPDKVAGEYITTSQIEGMDSLFLLSQLTSDKLHYFPEGTDFGAAAKTILQGQKFRPRVTLPNTGLEMTKPSTVRANEYILKRMNEFYEAGEFWDLAPTRYGNVTTFKRTVLGKSDPGRVLTSADVIGEIRLSPQRDSFCNQVFLSSNSPSADVTLRDGLKISYASETSPHSIKNADIISKAMSDSRDESLLTMRNRMIMTLEIAAGMPERVVIHHVPDPRFDIREAWQLDISQGDGDEVANGMYRVESMEFGLTPNDFAQITTLSHLVDTDTFIIDES